MMVEIDDIVTQAEETNGNLDELLEDSSLIKESISQLEKKLCLPNRLVCEEERKKLVVVIDDQELVLNTTYRIFCMMDIMHLIELKLFIDPKLGFKYIVDNEPDLAILDIIMPHFSGTEIAKEIRRRGLKTKILLVSGRIDDFAEEIESIKPNGVLRKPAKIEYFRETIVNLLGFKEER